MRTPNFIDPDLLRKHVEYDPKVGIFRLKIATKRLPVGYVFGTKYPNQYVSITVAKQNFRASRAAYVYMTGKQPTVIDHINGIKHDNRWVNLRNVTQAENMLNRRCHRIANGTQPTTEEEYL